MRRHHAAGNGNNGAPTSYPQRFATVGGQIVPSSERLPGLIANPPRPRNDVLPGQAADGADTLAEFRGLTGFVSAEKVAPTAPASAPEVGTIKPGVISQLRGWIRL